MEIEMPDTETVVRRKGFYEKNGFTAWPDAYVQPPFRPGDGFLPVMLCCYGDLRPARDFNEVRHLLHSRIYHYMED